MRISILGFLCPILTALVLPFCPPRAVIASEDRISFPESRFAHLLKEEVSQLKELHIAIYEVKTFYEDVKISAREQVYKTPTVADGVSIAVPDAVPKVSSIHEYQYWARGGKYFRLDGRSRLADDETQILSAQTGIMRPEGGYLLGFDRKTEKYFLKAHGRDTFENFSSLYSYVFPVGPICVDGALIDQFFFHPESPWHVESVETVNSDQVKVILQGVFPKGTMTRTFWFLPNRRWALARSVTESQPDADSPNVISRTVHERTYKPDSDGFPILESMTFEGGTWHLDQERFEPMDRRVTEITEFIPGPAELEVFDVDRLIPGFGNVGERESRSLWLWVLIVNGIVLVLIGLILARGSSKAKSPS